MKSNYLYTEFIVLCLLSCVPWPGPLVFPVPCVRNDARIVRRMVRTRWAPVLERFHVDLSLECPFHSSRDVHAPQERAKVRHRSSQWTCGLCGKSFFEEQHLDTHFDHRHQGQINMAEDAVCFADYCDLMRCDVLRSQHDYAIPAEVSNTDIEIWHDTISYKTELEKAAPRSLAKYNLSKKGKESKESRTKPEHCHRFEFNGKGNKDADTNSSRNMCKVDMIDLYSPVTSFKHQRLAQMQQLKANCNPEELQKLRTKCEILVRDCIAGLLVQLSLKDFKEIEEELNRATCWYLTCDRYWEDSHSDPKQFPWGLICMIVMVLSLGICVCYYIIWILFDTDDISVTSTSVTDCSSPAHMSHHTAAGNCQSDYTEERFATTDKDNECIYVTYPPDLKVRLLESCYNRTTRL